MESEACPRCPQMAQIEAAHISLPYDHYLVTQGQINKDGDEVHSRGGEVWYRKYQFPKQIQNPRGRDTRDKDLKHQV